ncbi:MAG TPA: ABC transporter substrate-binding protein [Thermoanaerobaculia bacterium]|jgi:peptide/nickel transport system substrate-binding protein
MFGKVKPLRSVFLTALLLAGSLIAGCDRGQEEPAGPAAAPASGPRRGGTVVTGWISEPGGVNYLILPNSQHTNEMLFRVFLHLIEEQPDFQDHPPTFAPQLATSWEWSPDHKTLTFHLRDDVVWTDGVPVTAEDVRWTWQAQINRDVAWELADSKQWITDVEVVGPHTVRYHYSRVYAKQLLDANEGAIVPKHAWERLPFSQWRQNGDWFKQHRVANGPFTIASWKPQQQIVLQRNDRYYEKGLPRLDRVVLRQIPDQAAGLTQLLNGELDFVTQIAPSDVPRVQANPRLEMIAYWFNLYVFIGWNNDRPLFKDPEVRRALTLAIDRKTIVDTLLGPYGRVASSPILTTVWAHDRSIQPWPYDPAAARRILAAKGWKDTNGDGVLDKGGKPFAFELISNAGNQLRTDATVMIQDQLKKVGVRATPRQIEFNTLIDQTMAGNFDAAILGYSMDTSLDLRSTFHSEAMDENGNNTARYSNPEVDRLIELAASQPDMLSEKPYLDRIQQILHREQPFTFLWESQRLTAANKRVRNVKPTMVASFFNLKEWWIEPEG